MSLRAGKVNPLNVLDLRRVRFPAHHFHYTIIERYQPALIKQLNEWIYLNMNGRYYIGQGLSLINNQFMYTTKLGFEQEKELSYFKLACPIHYQ
jgi:hypothetical protein